MGLLLKTHNYCIRHYFGLGVVIREGLIHDFSDVFIAINRQIEVEIFARVWLAKFAKIEPSQK